MLNDFAINGFLKFEFLTAFGKLKFPRLCLKTFQLDILSILTTQKSITFINDIDHSLTNSFKFVKWKIQNCKSGEKYQ